MASQRRHRQVRPQNGHVMTVNRHACIPLNEIEPPALRVASEPPGDGTRMPCLSLLSTCAKERYICVAVSWLGQCRPQNITCDDRKSALLKILGLLLGSVFSIKLAIDDLLRCPVPCCATKVALRRRCAGAHIWRWRDAQCLDFCALFHPPRPQYTRTRTFLRFCDVLPHKRRAVLVPSSISASVFTTNVSPRR